MEESAGERWRRSCAATSSDSRFMSARSDETAS
jgi:hypothetical protein